MTKNICRFVPVKNNYDQINAINFVYETEIPDRNQFITKSTYIMYLVTSGSGTLCYTQRSYALKQGDIFFTFPASPFAIEVDADGLEYIYISFLGIRAGKILDELGINSGNCILEDYGFLESFWRQALGIATQNNLDMLSESVLLYTLSVISHRGQQEEKLSAAADNLLKIKKYIDDNFTMLDLSLEKICTVYPYNKKYLSGALRELLHVGFSEYLRTLRLQHAHMLMNEGLSNVKDIALLSGFKDPLYFSKVFKNATRLSPKEYIASIKADRHTC